MAAELNLFRLIPSDNQETFTSKTNANFDAILNMGGGPPGIQGITGIQGVPGGQGVQGFQGLEGDPGSKWFVENTDPTSFGPVSPLPNEGDYWFDTNSLKIYKYIGSPAVWTAIGSLTVAGIFKDAVGDSNRVIFTNPTPLKSLVLSPINYGVGAPQTGTYKLKLIGSPGTPLQNFGVLESGAENLAAKQSYISVNTVVPNIEYSWELINPTGNIEFSAFGTSLDLIKSISSISKYEFNSNSFKIQLDPSERLMSFFGTPSGLNWHVGGHNALANSTERLLSVNDSGSIGIGDAFNNAVPGDVTSYDFRYDQLNPQLGFNAADQNFWSRWRGKVNSTVFDQLNVRHSRNFYDISGTPWMSSEIRLEHRVDSTFNHFIALGGGAKDTGASNRPSLRLGFGGTANDGYYLAADNGFGGSQPRIWIGEPTYIKDSTGATSGGSTAAKLNIQSLTSGAAGGGANAHTAIHLNFGTAAADSSQVGITAGHRLTPLQTNAGVTFRNLSTISGTQNQMSVNLAAGDLLTSGMRDMFTTQSNGESFFWSRSNGSSYLRIRSGAMYSGRQSSSTLQMFPNDVFSISGDSQGGAKSILLNDITNYVGFGDGFVGIGEAFSDTISAGPTKLTIGKWYKGPVGGIPVHNSIDYKDLVPFMATTTNLTSGSVVESKPQTKFHVFGATTLGTRATVLSYASDVGTLSLTHGNNQKATGARAVIIGGQDHVSTATDSVIIGFSGAGQTNTLANSISLATFTSLNVTAAARISRRWTINGDIAEKRNLLSLTTDALTGPNGIEIEVSSFTGGFIPGSPTRTITPLPTPLPLQITSNVDGLTFGTLLQFNGRSNMSIGGNPFEVPVGVSLGSVDTSYVYEQNAREREFVSGSHSSWSSLPNVGELNSWWFGDFDVYGQTTSAAALSIRGATKGIIFQNSTNGTPGSPIVPRISLSNLTINSTNANGRPLIIFGGILVNKTASTASQTRGADVQIIGGEAYHTTLTSIAGLPSLVKGGDVVIAGGRGTYNSGQSFGYGGNVIIGFDPLSSCVRPSSAVKVYSDVQMMDPAVNQPPVGAIVNINAGPLTITPTRQTLIGAATYDRMITAFTQGNTTINSGHSADVIFSINSVDVQRIVWDNSSNRFQNTTIPLPAGQILQIWGSVVGTPQIWMRFSEFKFGMTGTACVIPPP